MPDNSVVALPAPPGASFAPPGSPVVNIFNVTVPPGATVLGGYHTHPFGSVTAADGFAYTSGQYFSPNDFLMASPGGAFISTPGGPIYGGVPNSYIPNWTGLALGTNVGSNLRVFLLPNGAATGSIPTNSSTPLRNLMTNNAVDISACGKNP